MHSASVGENQVCLNVKTKKEFTCENKDYNSSSHHETSCRGRLGNPNVRLQAALQERQADDIKVPRG